LRPEIAQQKSTALAPPGKAAEKATCSQVEFWDSPKAKPPATPGVEKLPPAPFVDKAQPA